MLKELIEALLPSAGIYLAKVIEPSSCLLVCCTEGDYSSIKSLERTSFTEFHGPFLYTSTQWA